MAKRGLEGKGDLKGKSDLYRLYIQHNKGNLKKKKKKQSTLLFQLHTVSLKHKFHLR